MAARICRRVNAEGVVAGRKPDQHAAGRGLRQLGSADLFALSVFQRRFGALRSRRERRENEERTRQSGCPGEEKTCMLIRRRSDPPAKFRASLTGR